MLTGSDLVSITGLDFDDVRDVVAKPSWDLSIGDMLEISGQVNAAIDAGFDEVVVTHGTDTMEETAWLTDLLLGPTRREGCRVVFTGAMKFSDDSASDGPSNLSFARREAGNSAARGSGVQVAFAARLHAARWVHKIDAQQVDAFTSFGRPLSSGPLPPTDGTIDQAVTLVTVNSVARQKIPASMHGLVLRGTGASHVPSEYFEQIEQLMDRGIPVVLTTRARDVQREPKSSGVLYGGELSSEKAALALMVALGYSSVPNDIARWWRELRATSIR